MRPGFIGSFAVARDPVVVVAATFSESFEFSGSWPGTFDTEYWKTYSGFDTPSAAFSESFETAGGWPGT